MEKEIIVKDENGNDLTIAVLGAFKIDALEKEYIMYSLVDSDITNENGYVLLAEIIHDEDGTKILGIKDNEKDLVMAFYNEISDGLGKE